jgi:hypothetical protein
MFHLGPGTWSIPDQGLDVFLNDNIWMATAFALSFVLAVFALLLLLAWLEPSQGTRATPPRLTRSGG